MQVGVVDVGGNTARLLVARRGTRGIERVVEDRVVLGLGAEIEREGRISKSSLEATGRSVADLCARAQASGCARVDVVVTSPGRQSANRSLLEATLGSDIGGSVRFVTGEEEAALAHSGAVTCADVTRGAVAVVDVGGGSTEIAVGAPGAAPWSRSLDLGSLRLTHRCFTALPPSKRELDAARTSIRAALDDVRPVLPAADLALATGGTARALRKIVGRTLGPDELKDALRVLRGASPQRVARRFGMPVWRAAVLPAGAVLLLELQQLVGSPLVVSAGGLREGVALQLLAEGTQTEAA